MRSTATELGTPSIRVSSVQSRAWTPWNQVFQVASESWARTAAATFAHRSSAAGVPTVDSPSCPQVCPHVWRSARSGGPVGLLGRVPLGRDGSGKCPSAGAGRDAGGADAISAVGDANKRSSGARSAPRRGSRRRWSGRPVDGRMAGLPRSATTRTLRCPPAARVPAPLRHAARRAPRPRAHYLGPGVRGGHA